MVNDTERVLVKKPDGRETWEQAKYVRLPDGDICRKPKSYELAEGEAETSREAYEKLLNPPPEEPYEMKPDAEVISLLAQGKRRQVTEEIVATIKEHETIKTTRNDDKPEMWIYQEGIYKPNARSTIKQYARSILGEAYTTHLGNEITAKIEADTYVDEDEFFNEQNKNPYLLPVQNGLLNLKNRDLQSFTPKIAYFNKINASYKPSADCPSIKRFLREILGSEEDYKVIQELSGYILVREYKYEKAFMLYGSHGRNGKSKLLELLTRFVGSDNLSGVSLQDLERDDFALSSLHNKLVNISGDISNEAIKDAGRFKSLTGRDTLSANRKYRSRIEFINYAKVVFAANELPPVYTLSDSFWLRWVLVDFPYQFLPEKELQCVSEGAVSKVKPQDQSIIEKITTQEELDGFLNFALEGLERLEQNRDFSQTDTAAEVRKRWQRQSNSVAAFIEDCVEESADDYISKREFVKRYKEYCDTHRAKQMSDQTIKITLKEKLGVSESHIRVDDGRIHVWSGVRFVELAQGGTGGTGVFPFRQNSEFSLRAETPVPGVPPCASSPSFLNEQVVKAVKALIRNKGRDGLVSRGILVRWNGHLTDDVVDEAKKAGVLYEPRPGMIGVVD